MRGAAMIYRLIIIFFVSFFLLTKGLFGALCTIKINPDTPPTQRKVFLAGGDAYQLFERYLSELQQRNIQVNLKKIEVNYWDGKSRKTEKLEWGSLLTGMTIKEVWRRKLSKKEAQINEKELEHAHNSNYDIICIGGKQIKEQRRDDKLKNSELKTGDSVKDNDKREAKVRRRGDNECSVHANHHIQIGINFALMEQYDNALREFQDAVKKDPSCALAYANLVSAYVQKRHCNVAVDLYIEGLKKAGDNDFLHISGATAYICKEEYDKALRAFEKALAIGIKNIDLLEKPDLEPLFLYEGNEACKLLRKHGLLNKWCLQ